MGMSKREYLEYHSKFCEKMIEITKIKNADYTGGSEDPFANFKTVENFGCVSTEQGFFTRMVDKFSRIASFIKLGVLMVKEESVQDSLLDLANYCALFSAYIESQKSPVVVRKITSKLSKTKAKSKSPQRPLRRSKK